MKKKLFILLVIGVLTGCSGNPPLPKEPDVSVRVPINKEIPVEITGN